MNRRGRVARVVLMLVIWLAVRAAGASAETRRPGVLEPAVALWHSVAAQLRGLFTGEPRRKSSAPATEGGSAIDPLGAPQTGEPPSQPATEQGQGIDPLG
jgi:hypothetical protein